jgi:putative flippase GtrA
MNVSSQIQRLRTLIANAWRARAFGLKALSFGMVGVVNTLVDFGVFWVSVQYLAVPLVPANVLAWLVGVTGSYVLNSMTTFAAESGRNLNWRSYVAFVAAGVAGMIANTLTLLVANAVLSVWLADAKVALAAAKGCAILASFIVNFMMSYFVVFRAHQPSTSQPRR